MRNPERCRKCAFYWTPTGNRTIELCQYILMTGHPRPCPAGKDCTSFLTPAAWRRARRGTKALHRYDSNRRGGKIHAPSKWTPQRVDALLALRAAGKTSAQLAAHFGTTAAAIDSKLRDLRKKGVDTQRHS